MAGHTTREPATPPELAGHATWDRPRVAARSEAIRVTWRDQSWRPEL